MKNLLMALAAILSLSGCYVDYVDTSCPIDCYNGNCCSYGTVCNNFYLTCEIPAYYYLVSDEDGGIMSDEDAQLAQPVPQTPREEPAE